MNCLKETKRIALLILSMIMLLLCACEDNASNITKSHNQEANDNKNVIESYENEEQIALEDTDIDTQIEYITLLQSEIYHGRFDDAYMSTRYDSYNEDGTLDSCSVFEDNDELERISKYEYDTNGNVVKINHYDANGYIDEIEEYRYNNKGKIEYHAVCSGTGEVWKWVEYDYSEYDNVIEPEPSDYEDYDDYMDKVVHGGRNVYYSTEYLNSTSGEGEEWETIRYEEKDGKLLFSEFENYTTDKYGFTVYSYDDAGNLTREYLAICDEDWWQFYYWEYRYNSENLLTTKIYHSCSVDDVPELEEWYNYIYYDDEWEWYEYNYMEMPVGDFEP